MRKTIVLVMTAVLCPWPAFAEVDARGNSTEFFVDQVNTSTAYRVSTFNASYEHAPKAGLTYKLQGFVLDGQAEGTSVQMQRLLLSTKFFALNTGIEIQAGLASRKTSELSQAQFGEGTLHFDRKLNEALTIIFDSGFLTYPEVLQTRQAFEDDVRGSFARLTVQARPHEKIRIDAYQKTMWLSDGNTTNQQDIGVLYGISTGTPWIWLGLGVEKITNSFQTKSYWAPREFTDYGPRLDMSLPITEQLNLAIGLNLNTSQDAEAGTGSGYYLLSTATYAITKDWHVSLVYENIKSKQGGSDWISQAGRLGTKWDF